MTFLFLLLWCTKTSLCKVFILSALCTVRLTARSSYEWTVYFSSAFKANFKIDMHKQCHTELTCVIIRKTHVGRNNTSNSRWVIMQVVTLLLCICYIVWYKVFCDSVSFFWADVWWLRITKLLSETLLLTTLFCQGFLSAFQLHDDFCETLLFLLLNGQSYQQPVIVMCVFL